MGGTVNPLNIYVGAIIITNSNCSLYFSQLASVEDLTLIAVGICCSTE